MKNLSIIITIYNTKLEYFKECLESISLSVINDYEVVVIDDGSTIDYSTEIKKYDFIKYIKTKHSGTLSARLKGIEEATGKYICFVDSDDIVSFNYFFGSLNKIEETGADFVINDWAIFTASTKYVCKDDTTIKQTFEINGKEILTKYFETCGREHSWYVLWNKIFKRELLINVLQEVKQLNIDKEMKFAEDVLLTYFAYKNAKKLTNCHFGYYFYRLHKNQETFVGSQSVLEEHIKSNSLVFDIMQKDLQNIGMYESLKNKFMSWKNFICCSDFVSMKYIKSEDISELIKTSYNIDNLSKQGSKVKLRKQNYKVLPQNFEQVNKQLRKIYFSNKTLRVYAKENSYSHDCLITLKNDYGKRIIFVKNKDEADIIIKEKLSFIGKLLHNKAIHAIAEKLFPKGSKIRRFIKSKI